MALAEIDFLEAMFPTWKIMLGVSRVGVEGYHFPDETHSKTMRASKPLGTGPTTQMMNLIRWLIATPTSILQIMPMFRWILLGPELWRQLPIGSYWRFVKESIVICMNWCNKGWLQSFSVGWMQARKRKTLTQCFIILTPIPQTTIRIGLSKCLRTILTWELASLVCQHWVVMWFALQKQANPAGAMNEYTCALVWVLSFGTQQHCDDNSWVLLVPIVSLKKRYQKWLTSIIRFYKKNYDENSEGCHFCNRWHNLVRKGQRWWPTSCTFFAPPRTVCRRSLQYSRGSNCIGQAWGLFWKKQGVVPTWEIPNPYEWGSIERTQRCWTRSSAAAARAVVTSPGQESWHSGANNVGNYSWSLSHWFWRSMSHIVANSVNLIHQCWDKPLQLQYWCCVC